jgi:dihydropyrimidine dehydrogenase (NAD+) subunit PreA
VNPGATQLERVPRVDVDECVGCNLCALVCPVEDCITMVRVENGLASESWEERAKAGLVTATLIEG